MPTTPSPRRRGGQPGNQNARKHGYYSTVYRPNETPKSAAAPEVEALTEELDLLRLLIRRTVEGCTGEETTLERIDVLRAVSLAAGAVARLQRTRAILTGGTAGELQQALKEAVDNLWADIENGEGPAYIADPITPPPPDRCH